MSITKKFSSLVHQDYERVASYSQKFHHRAYIASKTVVYNVPFSFVELFSYKATSANMGNNQIKIKSF